MTKGKIYIGTSGWSYRDWRGAYYPEAMKASEYLSHYSNDFHASEINSTFYITPRTSTTEGWANKVPGDFKFCPKMHRYLTQMKRLRDPEQPLEKFFTAIAPLYGRLGPILLQLPPSLSFNEEVVTHLFEVLKRDYHRFEFVLEARHISWFEPLPLSLLRENNIALVISQSGVGYPYAESDASRNIYLRFHGPTTLFSSSYSDAMLKQYAGKIKAWSKEGHTVWAFFNNTMGLNGLNNARKLKELLGLK